MKRHSIYICVLLAALPGWALAAGQESSVAEGAVKVTVQTDREAAQVAEPIRLTLEVTAPKGTRVELPQLGTHLIFLHAHGSGGFPTAEGRLESAPPPRRLQETEMRPEAA